MSERITDERLAELIADVCSSSGLYSVAVNEEINQALRELRQRREIDRRIMRNPDALRDHLSLCQRFDFRRNACNCGMEQYAKLLQELT